MSWFALCRGLALAVVCAATISAGAQFTVREALSAPFSNQLTPAPAKARVAWFTDSEGRRNVWVAASHEAARAVTHNTEDDGQDMDELAWSRDGERLAWTRGTGASGGDHTLAANPAELPGRIQQHIEWVDLRGGGVHSLVEGHSALFLADGEHLLFLRRGAIWIADLRADPDASHAMQTGAPPSAEHPPSSGTAGQEDNGTHAEDLNTTEAHGGVHQLLFVRGSARGLRLSPDGTHLAFVSDRSDHSFIGVYTFATRALVWMDPGTGLDHDPVWSPDGKQIAFVREVPIVSPIADRWMREGDPWSIRVAEVATGAGREVWHADAGRGSLFHGVTAKDQLVWMRDGSVVFPWEKTGFVQLYRISGSGNSPPVPVSFAANSDKSILRAPDPATNSVDGWEVDAVATDGVRIVFSANAHPHNAEDVDRRHLWLADASPGGESPRPLTGGTQMETSPVLLNDGEIAYLQGWTSDPFAPVLLHDPMHRPMNRLAPELVLKTAPRGPFVEPYFVSPEPVRFVAADGMDVRGQLFLPRFCNRDMPNEDHSRCAHLPAVVFFHGGSRRQMLLGFHPMEYYHQAYAFNQYLASRGFAVLSVNYRSGVGYGLNFRQAVHYGANGASEDNDVVGAAKYLQSRPEIDPERIGAWGGSYGGYLTALALARHSDLYRAGVDLHGVHDWSLELDLWKPTDEPGADQAAIAKRAFASSPMASLDTWKSPVLLMQGDDDRNVLFAQTVRLAAELRRRGVPVEEKVFPDEVHDFLLHRNWIASYEAAATFLERNLRAR